MRYILDDRGYVKYCSENHIVCENKTCTLYEGAIPDGYETIEEWVVNANIRAYKIVNGNLVLDTEEDARLQEEYNEASKTYSTTEKIIGTWIDGKPVYQKTFVGNYASGSVLIENVDVLVNVKGQADSGGNKRLIPYYELYGSTIYEAKLQIDTKKRLVTATQIGSAAAAYYWIVTVEYTKTTD